MIDEGTIRKWWDLFVKENGFTEIRILGRFQYSGYFDNVDTLINAIKPYADMDDEQIYFVLNKIDDSCYGRQQSGKIVKSPKITTNDNDITRRHWVLCDFDPIRKSGTNSSDAEFELAHNKAQDVFRFLRERGFNDPIVCKSGNGWHNLYYIDEEVNDENKEIIKGFFKYMGTMFTDDKVDFDEKNFNEARICKLYGTTAKKGANLKDRPWRMSEIVYAPNDIKPTPLSKFKELADLLPKEEPKPAPARRQYQTQQQFDLRTWLNEHSIVYKEERQGSSTRFTLEYCPWVETHSDRKKWDSALFLDLDGKITFNCHHSHCKDKTWHDFRLFYEPNAYDKPMYQSQQNQYQYRTMPQKPKYEIKGEIPELGKKWLRPSDIKKVDLSKLEGVKTGYIELDNSIEKLHYGEVSVLSGSNASGKSSWLNSLILNIANQHVPTALWSGELPEPILMTWIHMVAAGVRHLKRSQYSNGKFYVPSDVERRIDSWLDKYLLIYNTEYGSQWEQLFADMEEVVNAGVKVIVLDNLMAMDINLLEGDKNEKQKQVILRLKQFAKEKQVHIIIVAHPRKSMAFLRKNDISGTADLQNAVDNIFIFHRVNNDFFRAGAEFFGEAIINQFRSYGNVIEVAKNRMYGIVDLMVGLHYEIESRRFKNAPEENVLYEWEIEPIEANMEFVGESNEDINKSRENLPFSRQDDSDAPF